MKKLMPLIIMTILAVPAIFIFGCDKLVTEEKNSATYDTLNDSSCVVFCHSDISNSVTIARRQWVNSAHSSDSLTNYQTHGKNTRICGEECHSTEGFVRSLSGTTDSVAMPTEIGCFACHHPHTTWDFSLRDNSAVTLLTGVSYDHGHSNICAHCHKSITDPADEVMNNVTISLPWGPHGSPQADMLAGTGGYVYEAASIGNTPHDSATAAGCLSCHKSKAEGFRLGGHSFKLSDGSSILAEACNVANCHAIRPVSDFSAYDSLQVAYLATTDSLRAKLIEASLLDSSDTPIVKEISTADSAGALYNYLFIINDKSQGVHNTRYGLSLLRQSLQFLNQVSPEKIK